MPDEYGNFRGQGWSQKRSDAWERVFGRPDPTPTHGCTCGWKGRGWPAAKDHVVAMMDAAEPAEHCVAALRAAESARENQNRETPSRKT